MIDRRIQIYCLALQVFRHCASHARCHFLNVICLCEGVCRFREQPETGSCWWRVPGRELAAGDSHEGGCHGNPHGGSPGGTQAVSPCSRQCRRRDWAIGSILLPNEEGTVFHSWTTRPPIYSPVWILCGGFSFLFVWPSSSKVIISHLFLWAAQQILSVAKILFADWR